MTFNSWEFLIFYPIVALLYFVLPKKLKWPLLLIASYYFYLFCQPELVFLIFGTTLVSWIASNAIERTEDQDTKRVWLAITLAVCLGVLFFYKYFNFLAGTIMDIGALMNVPMHDLTRDIILPVGISFYTFQTLSYVIDVYRGDVKTERNFFLYALFVSFFPQLVAGPIERPDHLIPQLREEHKWSNENAVKGAKHMIVGFFKKVCVADTVAVYVNSVYNNVEEASGIGIIIATLLFAVQIYCDFSGYTDIAIGCARIMGIRLMKNFDHPYMATSVKEFWARWHISLSSWFRDYLYIPLGGNRCSRSRHLFNLFVVFLVSGLWHGAAWTFVIWGAIHGVYQIFGNLTWKARNRLLAKVNLSERSVGIVWARRVITVLLVSFAWIFFRANSLSDAGVILTRLFTESGWQIGFGEALDALGLDTVSILMTFASLILLLFIDNMLTYDDSEDSSAVLTKNGAFIYFVWLIFMVWALLLSKDMISSFIYFQF